MGSVAINLYELEGSGSPLVVDRWFTLKGSADDEPEPQEVTSPLSSSPPHTPPALTSPLTSQESTPPNINTGAFTARILLPIVCQLT